jgi:uncharacterized protein YrrD
MTLEERVATVEKNLAIFQAGEESRNRQMRRMSVAMFGANGDPGMVDDVRFIKKVFKIVAWALAVIFAPLLGTWGFFTVKVLAHMDKILKLIEAVK